MPTPFQPFLHQEKMIAWGRERDVFGLLCSPGMGKSVVTLEWLDWILTTGRSRGALLISPLRVSLCTWPEQIRKWEISSWMKFADLRTPEGQQAWFDGSCHIYLANFDILATREVNLKCKSCGAKGCGACEGKGFKVRKDLGLVHKLIKTLHKKKQPLPVDALVIDELSLAKNHNSKRINALRAYNDHFKFRLGLTGSPVPNSYLDLFAQVRLLDNGERLGKTFHGFQQQYFEKADWHGYKWKLKPGAKEEIDRLISDLCLVMLGEDYLDIPTTATEDIMVTLPAAAMKAYKTLEKEMLVELDTGEITALSAAALCNKLLQCLCGLVYDAEGTVHYLHDAKIQALRKLCKKHEGEPILVFTAYKHEMERVLKEFPEAVRFDEKRIPDWKAGKIKLFICNPKSMAHGLDSLQHGGRISCWMTLTYSAETYLQANARLIRTGQSHNTIIYRLLVPKSLDEAVCEVLRRKDEEQTSCLQALKALQQLNS